MANSGKSGFPFQQVPHDTLRLGLPALKEEVTPIHPVEALQSKHVHRPQDDGQLLANLYGVAYPAKIQIERQLLASCGRLPGYPASQLGREILEGQLYDFNFHSYLGQQNESIETPPELHAQLEKAYKLGTERCDRGFV